MKFSLSLPLLKDLTSPDPFRETFELARIAEENGFDASTSATSTSPVDGSSAFAKHVKEGIGVAIGRIIGFRWLWKVTG